MRLFIGYGRSKNLVIVNDFSILFCFFQAAGAGYILRTEILCTVYRYKIHTIDKLIFYKLLIPFVAGGKNQRKFFQIPSYSCLS